MQMQIKLNYKKEFLPMKVYVLKKEFGVCLKANQSKFKLKNINSQNKIFGEKIKSKYFNSIIKTNYKHFSKRNIYYSSGLQDEIDKADEKTAAIINKIRQEHREKLNSKLKIN